MDVPLVEVHLSNIHGREAWHRRSCLADVALARVWGLGVMGYELALRGLCEHLREGRE